MIKHVSHGKGICLLLLFFVFTFFTQVEKVAAEEARMRGVPLFLVLPFQVNEGSTLDRSVNDLPLTLEDRLLGQGIRSVPNPIMLDTLRKENITAIDTKTAQRLAQLVGADFAVYGAVSQISDTLSIDARVVPASTNTSPIPVFIEKHGVVTNITPAVNDLAKQIANIFMSKGQIAGVEIVGTTVLDPTIIFDHIATRKGDEINPVAIDNEVKKIWDLGYFSDVQVNVENRPIGSVLVYTVIEKPRIDSISVEGAKEISESDILEAIASKPSAILNEKQLATDINTIIELYRKKGFFSATVEYQSIINPANNAAAIVFKINEGKEEYIRAVNITGVSQVSESDIKSQLLLKERNIFSWITGTGVLKEELIERDVSAITTYYMNQGYMDITVGTPEISHVEDGIAITFPVIEGRRYKLGKVSLDGDLIDTPETFYPSLQLKQLADKGGYFELDSMNADVTAITQLYGDYGYAFAEVNAVPDQKSDGIVNVSYHIMRGPKTYIRRVLVEGNSKTRDNVILREMRLTDGELFNGQKLSRSLERLNKLGYFESVESSFVPTEHDDETDLKIIVKERPTGAVMAGVGYSTFSKVGFSGTIMESNLWGKGYLVALQGATSSRRDSLSLSFTNPRLYDTEWSVGSDLYHTRDDYFDYKKRTTGGILRVGHPLGEYTDIVMGYRLDFYKLYDLDQDAAQIIKDYATGQRTSSVIFTRVTRDTTDSLRPTKGNIDSIGIEYGGGILAGDDRFITATAEHQTFYELAKDHVLHVRVKGAALFKNGNAEIPVFERFWMGGIDSVRGYDSRDIVPRDRKTKDRIGGTRMAFANLEYIWTVSNEFGVNLVPFYDIGFNIDAAHHYRWSDEIKKSTGLELRWRSPMGDLRFSYGVPLDKDRRGNKPKSGKFEFSMGQTF